MGFYENNGSRFWELCYTSSCLEDYEVTEELYMWYLLVIRVLCTFLHSCLFVMIEEMVVHFLSSLFGLASVCFSQKFARGRLLDICMLAALLLKQIFKCDVGHNVPTSWHGSVYPAPVPRFTHALSI